jgi:LPS export ABC transporter protein LptC
MKWLFAFCVAFVAITGCRKTTKPPIAGVENLADSAEQVIYDGRSLMTDRGVKRGEMFADTIYVFGDQTRFALRRVRATFNTETGALNGTLKGDRGTYDLRTQTLEGFGNVVVTSTDGKRLTSNHLKYAQMSNQISSDSAFTFYRGKDVQRGIGFVSDPNITVFRCLRACRVEADVPLSTIQNP